MPDNLFSPSAGYKVGDIVRFKQKDKTRSPYKVIKEFEGEKTMLVEALDDPKNGNRATRRARFAMQRKKKK